MAAVRKRNRTVRLWPVMGAVVAGEDSSVGKMCSLERESPLKMEALLERAMASLPLHE